MGKTALKERDNMREGQKEMKDNAENTAKHKGKARAKREKTDHISASSHR
jgi:hypothetical protein